MEHGGVYSERWIFWLPLGKKAPVFWTRFELRLVGRWAHLRPPTAPARRCTSCQVVEFSYQGARTPSPWNS